MNGIYALTNKIYAFLNNHQPEKAEQLLNKNITYLDLTSLNFVYNKLQEEFYRKRDIDTKFIEKAKEYCIKDIEIIKQNFSINAMFQAARHPSISRLINIYQKESSDLEAFLLCEWALNNGLNGSYLTKYKSLKKKLDLIEQ